MLTGNSLRKLIAALFSKGQCRKSGSLPGRRPGEGACRFRPGLEVLEDRLTPNAYVVNLAGDTGGTSGVSTGILTGDLRNCIYKAINAGGTDTITFNATVFNSAKTINLTNEVTDNPPGSNVYGPTAFVISGTNITITGSSAGVTINGGSAVALVRGYQRSVADVE